MKRNLADLYYAFKRSPIGWRLCVYLLSLTLYALAVYLIFDDLKTEMEWLHIDSRFHVLQGTILGLLLVFRTNTAYDRWWEGRKLWGQLVNDMRNLAMKVQRCVDVSLEEKRKFGDVMITFTFALKEHLSWKPTKNDAKPGGSGKEPDNVPLLVASRLIEKLNDWEVGGRLRQILIFDPHSRSLMDVCGACERIKRTPIARSYLVFIRLCIIFYLLTLPWGLLKDFHLWMVPATAIIGYFMIGIELIAENVEDPFGRGEDKLALEDICQGIERSVRQLLGERPA
jgi:ion channel-forming bestrophin family protein